MPNTIKPDNLAAEITAALQEYRGAVETITEDSVRRVMNDARNEVRANSPTREKGAKTYKRHWRTKLVRDGHTITGIVYQNKAYLTQLLEHGHAKVNGGRTEAIVHIAPAQEDANTEIERLIKEGLER